MQNLTKNIAVFQPVLLKLRNQGVSETPGFLPISQEMRSHEQLI